jgi:phytoene dehydrogenase-like protein
MATAYDAIVIGSGPNGLCAAITLAQTGRSVLVVEANSYIGGGLHSAELTEPGFIHDVCSAVHPLAVATSFFASLPLESHGLEWIQPDLPLAHPLDSGHSAVLDPSLERTGYVDSDGALHAPDQTYIRLMQPIVKHWRAIENDFLAPIGVPQHPLVDLRFAVKALLPAALLARMTLRSSELRALFAGLAAHSFLPLTDLGTSAVALVLGAAGHIAGWPIPKGGSRSIAQALASYFRSLGGEIVTGWQVRSLDELPSAPIVLCDTGPHALAEMAPRLPAEFRRALKRYRYGAAAFKLDWALREPIPWRNSACRRAGTVHIGGTLEEIVEAESAPARGRHAAKPFVLLAQPSLFDPSRAPTGKHTAWAYCHVPHASKIDMTATIEAQIERFAPGFRDVILARSVHTPADFERGNANLVGGDITGGTNDLRQILLRPTWRGYRTPTRGLYLCSASTPPGGGVHGLCGYYAARAALKDSSRLHAQGADRL